MWLFCRLLIAVVLINNCRADDDYYFVDLEGITTVTQVDLVTGVEAEYICIGSMQVCKHCWGRKFPLTVTVFIDTLYKYLISMYMLDLQHKCDNLKTCSNWSKTNHNVFFHKCNNLRGITLNNQYIMLKLFLFLPPTKANFEAILTPLERYLSRNQPPKDCYVWWKFATFWTFYHSSDPILESTLYAPEDSNANMKLHIIGSLFRNWSWKTPNEVRMYNQLHFFIKSLCHFIPFQLYVI